MDDTWKCHICGKERPDAAISVHSKVTLVCGVEMTENIRYCNDNPECKAKAPGFSFFEDLEEGR